MQARQETRTLELTRGDIDTKARTVKLSFSSSEPYERSWGTEILDHSEGAVDLGRLNAGAALLVDHDTRDVVGVVEHASVKSGRGHAVVRFGSGMRASEVFQDVQDGIRRLVSVGYRILDMVLESRNDTGETWRITRWEPYELSLVAVPADPTVGVGRTATFTPERKSMNAVVLPALGSIEARNTEVNEILALGKLHNLRDLAEDAVRNNLTLDRFKGELLTALEKRNITIVGEASRHGDLGMNARDVSRFNLCHLIDALANPRDRHAQERAAFELEVVHETSRKRTNAYQGQRAGAVSIPREILWAPQRRDLVVGTSTLGGGLVANTMRGSDFIEVLRSRSLVMALGATMLRDLQGNAVIPRQTGGANVAWVAEAGAAPEGSMAFDQITLTPKTVTGWIEYSRRFSLQSSVDAHALVTKDLAQAIATAIDAAAINGTGASNQPRGVMQTSGIGGVAGGTNGGAPTWDHIVQLEESVAALNADFGSLAYLTNPRVRSKLRRTQRFSGSDGAPVWGDPADDMGMSRVAGYPAGVTTNVPSNLTKGTASGICSAIVFGNWADLLIGMWSGLDLLVDPFTNSTTGTIRVIAFQDVDVAVRQPASFAAMLDALTT